MARAIAPVLKQFGSGQAGKWVSVVRMAASDHQFVRLQEADHGLLDDIPEPERQDAAAQLWAQVSEVDQGPVDGAWDEPLPGPSFGLLVLSGCVAREALAGSHGAMEVLGPGDLLRPWDEGALLDEPRARWRALDRTSVALLDGDFARRAARWPEVAATLLARVMRRQRAASLMLALRTLPRVEDRVLAALWLLAERMGHVTSEGVTVRLPLRQADVGAIAGARRPTVNVTLKGLREEGLLLEWTARGFRLDQRAGSVVAARLRVD